MLIYFSLLLHQLTAFSFVISLFFMKTWASSLSRVSTSFTALMTFSRMTFLGSTVSLFTWTLKRLWKSGVCLWCLQSLFFFPFKLKALQIPLLRELPLVYKSSTCRVCFHLQWDWLHSRFLLQVHSIVHDIGPYPWKKMGSAPLILAKFPFWKKVSYTSGLDWGKVFMSYRCTESHLA